MVFEGKLDNFDGLTIRKNGNGYMFSVFDHDKETKIVREVEVGVSRNMIQELLKVGLDGTKPCRVRVTIEVLP